MEEKKKKETTLEDIRRGLIFNRILTIITLIPLIVIIVVGVIGYFKVQEAIVKVQPIVQQVQEIDFKSLQNTVTEVNGFVDNTDFDALSNTIESIPADIFVQIDNIQKYLGQIASLTEMKDDMATAMENLDNLTAILTDLQEKMAPVFRFFGK